MKRLTNSRPTKRACRLQVNRRARGAGPGRPAGHSVEGLEVRRLLAATTPGDSDPAANAVSEGAAAGTAVGVTASSTDPNGTAVSYALADSAGGRFAVNATTGVVTVANGASALLDGPAAHSVTVQASDAAGGTATQSFSIAVVNVAPSPRVGGNASVNEGSPYTLNLSAADPGPDAVASWT